MSTPDHADWNLPSAIASSIANGTPGGAPGGVPLLHGSSPLGSAIRTAVTAADEWSVSQADINISYEFYLDAICETVNTTAPMTVSIICSDTTTGLILDTQTYQVWPAADSASGPQKWAFRGPMTGNTISASVINQDPAGTIQINALLQQSGRPYPRHVAVPLNIETSASTRNTPNADPAAGVLAMDTFAGVGSTGSEIDQLPMYRGKAYLHFHTGSGAADCEVKISAADDPSATLTGSLIYDQYCDATGLQNAEIYLPGVQCFLTIINHNASSRQLDYALTAADY